MMNNSSNPGLKRYNGAGAGEAEAGVQGKTVRRAGNRKKRSVGTRIFNGINLIIMILVIVITLIPFLNVIAKAVSGGGAVSAGLVTIYPIDFQLDTVQYLMKDSQFLSAMKNTVFITLVGTAGSMILSVLTAYPLSKTHLRGRKFFMYLYMFCMLFSGGMVPSYLLYRSLHLVNTIWSLVLSGMFSVYNMLVLKSFFETLPDALEEAGKVDGASYFKILFRIVLPISKPVLATVTLFYAVSYWNSYLSSVMYITKQNLKPLQRYLYDLVTAVTSVENNIDSAINMDLAMNLTGENTRAAAIVVGVLPILCVYPFLQKYFQQGMTIGAVKG